MIASTVPLPNGNFLLKLQCPQEARLQTVLTLELDGHQAEDFARSILEQSRLPRGRPAGGSMSEFNEPWKATPHEYASHDDPCFNIVSQCYPVRQITGGKISAAHDGDGTYHGLSREDAERIVACVNFCRNLPTDFLERCVVVGTPEWPGQPMYSTPNKPQIGPAFGTADLKVRQKLEGE